MRICRSIAPESMDEALRLIGKGGRAITELRVDRVKSLELGRLLPRRRPDLIITNRRRDEGGDFAGAATEQVELLTEALERGAGYVDMELSWGNNVVRKIVGKSSEKVICSYHNFLETPTTLPAIYEKCRRTGAGIVKLATMANDICDTETLFRVMERARRDRQPLIGLCMGERGQISRILGGKFGAFLTFASVPGARETGPGQLTVSALSTIFHIESIDSRTKIFGLLGNPVRQSRGILFHNARFRRRRFNGVYVNFLVDDPDKFYSLFRHRITGLSVTMPFKSSILSLVDSIDAQAREIGAANTVVRRKGRFVAYNTDLPAITGLIRRRTSLKGKRVTILGTGATARTMAFASLSGGAKTTVVGRTAGKARQLAAELSCGWGNLDELPETDILMNGTAAGMDGDSTRLVPQRFFSRRMLVFDAVYEPPLTRLLTDARGAGCAVITGLELFERQATLQSALFMEEVS